MSICLFTYDLNLHKTHKELSYEENIISNFRKMNIYHLSKNKALGLVDSDETARKEAYELFKTLLIHNCEGITDDEICCYVVPVQEKK